MFIAAMIFITACKKETLAPEAPVNEMASPASVVLKTGLFTSGPYGTVTGSARVLRTDGATEVLLDSLMSSNGPDLYVYLSKEIMPVNFVSLGKLKSTMGSQLYSVPAGTNVADFKYVCVHCQQYNHLFGYAPIQ
jgi:Electron transfer DM13